MMDLNNNYDGDELGVEERVGEGERRVNESTTESSARVYGSEPGVEETDAPPEVGVYERPERPGLSPAMMALIALVLLVVAALVIFFVFL